jgi:hypothetical protein
MKGPQVTFRYFWRFRWLTAHPLIRDKAPWAGSPGLPAFAGIRFVGFQAHAFEPTYGHQP